MLSVSGFSAQSDANSGLLRPFICPFILNGRRVLFVNCGCALQPLNLNCFRVHLYPLGEISPHLIFLHSQGLTDKMLVMGLGERRLRGSKILSQEEMCVYTHACRYKMPSSAFFPLLSNDVIIKK